MIIMVVSCLDSYAGSHVCMMSIVFVSYLNTFNEIEHL